MHETEAIGFEPPGEACSNFSGSRNSYNKIINDFNQKRNTSPAKIV
jgi:hypothetical protein